MRRLLTSRDVAAIFAAATLAGCADRSLVNEPAASPEVQNAIAFTCEASVPAQTVSCVRPGATIGGGSADIRIGKQGEHVQLSSSNVGFDGARFTFDVTIQNLIPQPLGTTDGVTPHANGVRIFFLADPVATVGSGVITVSGDGTGTFTSANQAYYQYSGAQLGGDGILSQNETSAAKQWTLNIPATVTQFTFGVLVAAEVPNPDGYVDVTPARDTMLAGQFQALTATLRDAYGAPLAGSVTWGTSDPAIATVDVAGNVTAVGPGTATITATSGTVFGTATVAVCANLPVGSAYTPASADFCLGGGAAGAEYTIVPTNTDATIGLNYSLTGAGIVPVVGGPTPDLIAGFRTLQGRELRPDDAWEYRFREREQQQMDAFRRTGISGVIGARVPGGIQPAITPGVPTVGDIMSINVNANEACTNPVMRNARVAAVGTRIIILADETNPAGMSDADYAEVAATFDGLIYPVITQNFGAPGDIDANMRVIALYTNAVNALSIPGSGSYVGGFVWSRDLVPQAFCAGSNLGEMFYMLAADPTGVHGNIFSVDFVKKQTLGTLGHEFQHLINSSYRVANNHDAETVWLNEGLSHIAEELLYYEVSGYAPGQNIGLGAIAVNQAQIDAYFDHAGANVDRLRSWMLNPTFSGPFSSNDLLSTRGAIWAFLRYAADRSGADESTVWSQFISSGATGTANIAARFGIDPNTWFRDWAASMYIDDAAAGVGVANKNPSWNFRSLFSGLSYGGAPASFPLAVRDPANGVAEAFTLAGGGASAFLRMGVPGNSFAGVTGNTTPGAKFGWTVIRRK